MQCSTNAIRAIKCCLLLEQIFEQLFFHVQGVYLSCEAKDLVTYFGTQPLTPLLGSDVFSCIKSSKTQGCKATFFLGINYAEYEDSFNLFFNVICHLDIPIHISKSILSIQSKQVLLR